MFRKNVNFARWGLYLLLFFCSMFLYFIGNNGEPFSLALAYAMMGAGLSLPVSAAIGALPAAFSGSALLFLLYVGQALLLALGYFLQRRLRPSPNPKTGLLPMLALSLSMGLFIGFAPFNAYLLPLFKSFPLNEFTQRVLFAALIFLLATVFYVALRALLRKLLKCRLRSDEIAFCVLLFALTGIGICRFLSVNAYVGIAFLLLLLFAYAVKDANAMLAALCLSLPPLFTAGLSPERFFLYGGAVTLFVKSGKLSAVFALLAVYFGYGYFDGLYAYPAPLMVQSLLSALLPCLLFLFIPTSALRAMENKLIFYREKHLSRLAINRNRAAIGEKLLELSAVFKEVEAAFLSLDDKDAEASAQAYVLSCVKEQACARCPNRAHCEKEELQASLRKLVSLGCVKGKVNLIDLPRALSDVCACQSDLLYALNHQLVEYKNYRIEAENAASGRGLLAGQAQGVSEILRNLALEQSQPLRLYTDKERLLSAALMRVGIVCSELLIYGDEENLTLSLVTFGNADVKRIAAVASHLFDVKMMISEKIALSNEKFCCVLRRKPLFDAAFGVATVKKTGERESGDTHSVVKIDERKFMVALSDGMGSGEYAHKVSESTLSLLESFYRAKMPAPLVLNTVNKLLSFNKEESFACVDVAVVDLDSGRADVVKIGSPLGFILSESAVKVLESNSLPMGILDALHPDAATYKLAENDVLLFLSDGVADAFGSTADLYERLKTVDIHNPQQLADGLLERALELYGGVAKDDMTAVAVRLFKSKPAA